MPKSSFPSLSPLTLQNQVAPKASPSTILVAFIAMIIGMLMAKFLE